jgi:NosR/NirI family transcriptional regulator, nitrous oxide reductase regulator
MSVRLVLRIILTLTLVLAPVSASSWLDAGVVTAQEGAASEAQAPSSEPADESGWTFDDEEEAQPTWADEVRNQATDIVAVTAFLALAFVSFFRKSRALKYVTLVAAVAYLGFYKSQLISIVNVFGVIGGNLPLLRYSLGWYLLVGVGVLSTVLWGRVYCGRICAFGAFTQLLDQVVPARLRVDVPRHIEKRASLIKYVILAGAIVAFLVTRDQSFYPYIEPFWMFGLTGRSPMLWTMLAVLLIATVFVRNLYCRFLCPVGAALGLLSSVTVFKIKRWSECKTCRICEKACEWGAIRGPKIILTECVRCDDCERLYADEAKCPHHRIIFYKNRKALEQGAS